MVQVLFRFDDLHVFNRDLETDFCLNCPIEDENACMPSGGERWIRQRPCEPVCPLGWAIWQGLSELEAIEAGMATIGQGLSLAAFRLAGAVAVDLKAFVLQLQGKKLERGTATADGPRVVGRPRKEKSNG